MQAGAAQGVAIGGRLEPRGSRTSQPAHPERDCDGTTDRALRPWPDPQASSGLKR